MTALSNIRLQMQGGAKVERDFLNVGTVGERSLKRIERAAKPANDNLRRLDNTVKGTGAGLRNLGQSAAVITGPLGGVASRLTGVASILGQVGPLGLAASLSIGGLGFATVKAIGAAAKYEQQMFRVEAILKATGSAAGLTANEIDKFAKKLGRDTLTSASAVRDAAGALLTFKSITGDTFTQTLSLAQDLSATFGQDLRGSVVQLGKALEDPIRGLTALRRVGVSFTQSQKDMIKSMVESGNQAEAQRLILQALEDQVGGAGKGEAAGLTGKVDTLGESWTNFLEAMGDTKLAQAGVEALTDTIDGLTAALTKTRAAKIDERINVLIGIASKFPAAGNPNLEKPARLISIEKEIQRLFDELDKLRGDETRQEEEEKARATADAKKAASEAEAERQAQITADLQTQLGLLEKQGGLIGETAEQTKIRAAGERAITKALRVNKGFTEEQKDLIRETAEAVEKEKIAFTEAAKEAERIAEAGKKAAETIADTLGSLEEQNQVLALRAEGREEEAAIVEAILDLERDIGQTLSEEQVTALEEQISLKIRLNAEIKAQAKAEREAARIAREAIRDRERDFRDLSNTFFDLFTGRSGGFWEQFKNDALRAFSDIAARLVFPDANGKGASSAGFTDIFGTIFNVSDGEGTAGGFSQALGGAGLGAGFAQLLSSINGRDGKISTALGSAGGAIGSIFGPLGQIIGAAAAASFGSTIEGIISGEVGPVRGATELLGPLLPFGEILQPLSLLGISPFGKTAASFANLTSTGFSDIGKRGKGKKDTAESLASGVIDRIAQIAEALGGTVAPGVALGQIGTRKKKFIFTGQPTTGKLFGKKGSFEKFDTAEQAVEAAVRAALAKGAIDGLTAESQAILKSATNIEEAIKKIRAIEELELQIRALVDGLDDAILQLEDPEAFAQQQLEDSQRERLELFVKGNADLIKVEKLFQLEREKLNDQFVTNANAALESLLSDLTSGPLSFLSGADKLSGLRSDFNSFAAKLGAGEDVDFSEFQETARAFLAASRDVNASSSSFFRDQQAVVDVTRTALDARNIGNVSMIGDGGGETLTPILMDLGLETIRGNQSRDEKLDRIADELAALRRDMNGGGIPVRSGGSGSGGIEFGGGGEFRRSFRALL